MPRDEVDIRNIVLSKRVPRVAPRLLDPLNGADAANAIQAAQSSTTEKSLDTIDQSRTTTQDLLPELGLPLKRWMHLNEIEGDNGKQFPGLYFHWLFHSLPFLAAKCARSTVSTTPGTTTPRLSYSPTIEEVEDEDIPTPVLGTARHQPTVLASDEENEETDYTSMGNAARKGFLSGTCFICLVEFKPILLTAFTREGYQQRKAVFTLHDPCIIIGLWLRPGFRRLTAGL